METHRYVFLFFPKQGVCCSPVAPGAAACARADEVAELKSRLKQLNQAKGFLGGPTKVVIIIIGFLKLFVVLINIC